jgi:hypothetical protein
MFVVVDILTWGSAPFSDWREWHCRTNRLGMQIWGPLTSVEIYQSSKTLDRMNKIYRMAVAGAKSCKFCKSCQSFLFFTEDPMKDDGFTPKDHRLCLQDQGDGLIRVASAKIRG